MRAADGLPAAAGQDGLLGHRHPIAGQQGHDPPDAPPPVVGQFVLEGAKLGVGGVDEVAEDVDLALVEERRELDARDESDVQLPRRRRGRRKACHRVVVGQRPRHRPRARHPGGYLHRGVLPVRGSRMSVQVDDVDDTVAARVVRHGGLI
jgi:hypothetical protein